MIDIYAATYAGSMHDGKNQDRAAICGTVLKCGELHLHFDSNENELVAGICDGVGGEKGGDLAAQFVASQVAQKNNDISEETLTDINRDLLAYAEQVGAGSMATTLAVLTVKNDSAVVRWSGNSRVYASCGERYLQQITRDHTVCDTSDSPITSCMGGGDESLFRLSTERINSIPSRFLLTTDGGHNFIEHIEMQSIVFKTPPERVCKTLIERATENGSVDDMTAVLIVLT